MRQHCCKPLPLLLKSCFDREFKFNQSHFNWWPAGAACFVENLPVWWLQAPTDKSWKRVYTSFVASTKLMALVADWTNWFYWLLQSTNRISHKKNLIQTIFWSFRAIFDYYFYFTCLGLWVWWSTWSATPFTSAERLSLPAAQQAKWKGHR